MPFLRVPTRRQFLQSAAATAAAALSASSAAQATRVRWAFLSDTHIPADPANEYRGFRPHANLRQVAPMVAEANVEGALINGDLARLLGLEGDYVNLKTLLQPVSAKMPIAMSLGNHDHRKHFLTAFADHPGEEQTVENKHVLMVPAGPVKLLLLDSLLEPNLTPGLLGKEQRTWLERYLPAQGSTPILVFMHHTPGDRDSDLLDTDRLLRILAASKNVKSLIYGHSHRYNFDEYQGLRMINLPAVGYNFADDQPVGFTEVEIGADGADFKLRAIGGNREGDGKITSVSWRA